MDIYILYYAGLLTFCIVSMKRGFFWRHMNAILSVFMTLFAYGCSSQTLMESLPPQVPVLPSSLEESVISPWRTESNRLRDPYRHPLETLEFFGIKANMAVVEVSPGTGWFTEILAPFLNKNGKYIAAVSTPQDGPNKGQMNPLFLKWMESHPSVAEKMTVVKYNLPYPMDMSLKESADRVLTFINFHNWMEMGHEKLALASFFQVLKPGGILGIVQHRGKLGAPQDIHAKDGYVQEKYLINLARKAGFKFLGRSEINSNSADVKNYPEGVWTLPPTLKLGEKDKDKYLAIGESDKMTLKFLKPR